MTDDLIQLAIDEIEPILAPGFFPTIRHYLDTLPYQFEELEGEDLKQWLQQELNLFVPINTTFPPSPLDVSCEALSLVYKQEALIEVGGLALTTEQYQDYIRHVDPLTIGRKPHHLKKIVTNKIVLQVNGVEAYQRVYEGEIPSKAIRQIDIHEIRFYALHHRQLVARNAHLEGAEKLTDWFYGFSLYPETLPHVYKLIESHGDDCMREFDESEQGRAREFLTSQLEAYLIKKRLQKTYNKKSVRLKI